ncbi:ABC transporter substrate-binding protein [Leucobacter luti]|uniref:Amino acid ABC transporter substrate-binding protein (PAAT family) n=1 Tax=Leucobacter luti TaxID=340320 RepID=A0A4V6MDK8_9MICO|nr:ABC transporter substrate-binding protein [Leucobacter luti]MBL3700744.1 ABC transporter substrate-binding protein [Leucobacter luti]RZT68419.1 amino acid ABC transporter substrate-binding protein (PAAT family) [Leucobacter luti]
MKKLVQISTAAALAAMLGLTACSSGGGETEAKTDDAPAAAVTSGVDEAAAAALPEAIRDSGVIRAAAGIPYPPFILLEGEKQTGLDPDLAQALGEKLGVDIEISHQAFETVIPSLQAKKFDIIMSGMNDTVEREETLNFIEEIYAGFTIVVKAGNPEGITGLDDLCGHPVAVQKASAQLGLLEDLAKTCEADGKGELTIQQLPTAQDPQTALKAGRVVAYPVDAPVAAYTVATAGDGKDFEVVNDPEFPAGINPVYTGIGTLKENTELTEALRLALQALIEEGVYQDILDTHNLGNYATDEAIVNGASTEG